VRPATLFWAWLVHDLEEVVTMPATARRLGPEVTHAQAGVAIGAMGVLVAVAARRGERTGGRDGLYQAVTAGLQAHVLTHVATSAFLRGYSTGVVTAVTVLLPQTISARRRERAVGVLRPGPVPYLRGVAVLVPTTVACQALGRWTRRVRNR